MLNFLRKIRKSLIDSESTRKYILYGIGEIVLVVIGILIALQINNWNGEHKESKVIHGYFLQLSEEFDSLGSKLGVKSSQSEAVQTQIRSCQELIMGKEVSARMASESLEKLQVCLGYLSTSLTNDLRYPIFQEFIDQGYMSKIDDLKVKAHLVELIDQLRNLKEIDQVNLDYYNNNIEPYFISNINYSKIVS